MEYWIDREKTHWIVDPTYNTPLYSARTGNDVGYLGSIVVNKKASNRQHIINYEDIGTKAPSFKWKMVGTCELGPNREVILIKLTDETKLGPDSRPYRR